VATNSNVVKTTPLVGYTLMGILNLGERSAVLFKVDGNHQRVWIGETVGNTGWILNSIEEQQAVLKRNGESKTLKIGDIF
jgi:Tfp pilus assembly protein PilP